MNFIYYLSVKLCWLYAKLVCRVNYIGVENIPPDGGFLLTANHISYFDPFLIAGKINRYVRFLAMDELFKNPLTAFWMRHCQTIPIKRNANDSSALKQAIKCLKDNEVVGVFPEGAIVSHNNNYEYKAGVAMLVLHSKQPVMPVVVEGTRNLYHPWKRGTINIFYKKAFFIDDTEIQKIAQTNKKELRKRVVELIERRIKDNV